MSLLTDNETEAVHAAVVTAAEFAIALGICAWATWGMLRLWWRERKL